MKYHLFLHKYTITHERFHAKLKTLGGKNLTHEQETLIIEGTIPLPALTAVPEIKDIYILTIDWKPLKYPALKKDSLAALQTTKHKTYLIKTKFYDKIPISARSLYKHINPYVKHEGYTIDETSPDVTLFIEIRKEDKNILYRVSVQPKEALKKITPFRVDMKNLSVALEEPELTLELGDFLRLCYIFKLPLYILTQKPDSMKHLLTNAREETKGIPADFPITIVKELPDGFTYVGFTKHAPANEEDLKEHLNQGKTLLVFGNDKYGLSQELRDELDYQFRLTPELKKPLRGSHALSYVLGFYTHMQM